MSVGAASIAETVTYPLDLTKTRLQLQGEVAAGEKVVKYRGMIQTAFGIVKEEVSYYKTYFLKLCSERNQLPNSKFGSILEFWNSVALLWVL